MSDIPFQRKVNGTYGAPMGRRSDCEPEHLLGKVHLRRIPLVDGDYDQGGAYWGGVRGSYMFCAWKEEQNTVVYFRAGSREEAKKLLPNCTFYN